MYAMRYIALEYVVGYMDMMISVSKSAFKISIFSYVGGA